MNKQKEKILVTGGAGFIGSHLCERLLKEGFSVISLDNFSDFYDHKLKKDNIKGIEKRKGFLSIKGDIRDINLVSKIFSENKISKIIHLAAIPGVRQSINNPIDYVDVNVLGTTILLEVARKHGVSQFIFGSSSTVYGQESQVPFHEKEKNLVPISPYGASKLSAEILCRTYNRLYKLPVTVLRFFCVYGPRQRPELVLPKFIRLIKSGRPIQRYGSGKAARDYTYIEDIIDGIMKAIGKEIDFEIFNLGNSTPVKLEDLISILSRKMNMKIKTEKMPHQLGDVQITCADISKSRKMLGWKPKYSLEQGVEGLLKWYDEKKELLNNLKY